jgi:hypothetical protein
MSRQEADQLAYQLVKADVILYADAVHQVLMDWLAIVDEAVLDETADVAAHHVGHPEYLTPAMLAEAPWLAERPSVYRCLGPAFGHVRDHLVELDLLKRHRRENRDLLQTSP